MAMPDPTHQNTDAGTPSTTPGRSAEIVIIGGGAMGTSTAYHLARAGVTDVVLVESHDLAAGSSGKPLGGVRGQFSDAANIELGARSLHAFKTFDQTFGTDIGLREVGYLFLLRRTEDVAGFEASVALQNTMGVPSRMITPAEAQALCPYTSADALVAATYSASDGFARPRVVVRGWADAAAALGAEVRTHCPVLGIDEAADGSGYVVRTDHGDITTATVICAAGAWSPHIGAMVGVNLPIEPLRRQIAFTPPLPANAPDVPFTIDYSTTAYFHRSDDAGMLLGIADPDQAVGYDTSLSTGWHQPLRAALARCAPELAEKPIVGGWAGLYEMTPDCNALIGETPVSTRGGRFLYAAGFSGHGFLQSPAVGEVLRDLYLGREPVVDPTPFDAARFTGSAVRTELNII